jgi:nitric oxide reductase activation protein
MAMVYMVPECISFYHQVLMYSITVPATALYTTGVSSTSTSLSPTATSSASGSSSSRTTIIATVCSVGSTVIGALGLLVRWWYLRKSERAKEAKKKKHEEEKAKKRDEEDKGKHEQENGNDKDDNQPKFGGTSGGKLSANVSINTHSDNGNTGDDNAGDDNAGDDDIV